MTDLFARIKMNTELAAKEATFIPLGVGTKRKH